MTRAALKLASAALSPERQALSDAIALHAEADRLARRNTEAHGRAEAAIVDSYGPEAEAERTLQAAKADAPARVAAEFRGETPKPGPTVTEAEAALAALRQKRTDIRAARDALEKEASLSRSRAEWKLETVKAAAAFVVKASPEAHALVEALADAERRHARLQLAVQVLAREGALPNGCEVNSARDADRSDEMAWIGALEALRSDPSAPLPAL